MTISMSRLLANAFPSADFDGADIDQTPFIERLRKIGSLLCSQGLARPAVADRCWVSDTVRGWLAMAASEDTLDLGDLLVRLEPYATDHHFAVREWAWLAARPHVARDPDRALELLRAAVAGTDPLIRRFAVEVTRPRSVWGEHIPRLKAEPELAERLLDLAMCDPDEYVRRSVGNWISDAARSRPDWVRGFSGGWSQRCECTPTRRILTRVARRFPDLSGSWASGVPSARTTSVQPPSG